MPPTRPRRPNVARALTAVGLLALIAQPSPAAGPVDDLLRVAPPDAAFTLVVRDARGHAGRLAGSPFADWFPSTPAGRAVLDSPDVRKLRDAVKDLAAVAGTTPTAVLEDVLGDAVVFAFRPGAGGDPKDERGVLLIRPRKPAVLHAVVARLDAVRKQSGELLAVESRNHDGEPYAARRKKDGTTEYGCVRGDVFAFSTTPAEVTAVIDRDKTAPAVAAKTPPQALTLERLGVGNVAAALLINPRALDADLAAKAAAGGPDEQPFLRRFGAYWASLESAAVYLDAGRDLELGLAVRFTTGRPNGVDPVAALWSAVPADALFAAAGRQKLSELAEFVESLLPAGGRAAARAAVDQTLGPVVGEDKLPIVVDALGPDWGLWVERPAADGDGFLPVVVFALEVRSDGPRGGDAAKALTGAVDYAFQTARVAYNWNHRGRPQLSAAEERDGEVVIRSLAGDGTLPPGVRPAFALKDGFLLLAGHPDPIRRFRRPAVAPAAANGEVPLVRVSAASARAYLQSRGEALAAFVSRQTGQSPSAAADGLRELADALEPFDRLDVVTRPVGGAVHVTALLKMAKPLGR